MQHHRSAAVRGPIGAVCLLAALFLACRTDGSNSAVPPMARTRSALVTETGNWSVKTTKPLPTGTGPLLYDAASKRTLMFATSVWSWDGTSWAAGANLPANLDAVTLDGAHPGHAVATTPLECTWTPADTLPCGHTAACYPCTGSTEAYVYDGAAWTHAASGPSDRVGATLGYDPVSKHVILFGGGDCGLSRVCGVYQYTYPAYELQDDTWSFDGTSWTQLSPTTKPTAMMGGRMTVNTATGHLVLAGSGGAWEWNGSDWKLLASGGPTTRSSFGLAYDSARGALTLFGDAVAELPDGTSTWTTDPTNGVAPPVSGYNVNFAYDVARNVDVNVTSPWSVFERSGTTWSRHYPAAAPPPFDSFNFTADSLRKRSVLSGQTTDGFDETWEFDGTTWTEKHPAQAFRTDDPSARDGKLTLASMSDLGNGKILAFGGRFDLKTNDTGLSNATFLYDGNGGGGAGSWSKLSPALSPPGVSRAAMAYDAYRKKVVLAFGERSLAYPGTLTNEVWEYDPSTSNWSNVTPAVGAAPQARYDAVLAWDPAIGAHGAIVAFGGYGADYLNGFTDTWTWDGKAWSAISTPTSASSASDMAMTYFAAKKRLVLVSGSNTWEFDGATWHEITAAGITYWSERSLVSDPATGTVLVWTGDDLREYQRPGASCTKASDCYTGSCVDGVCCDGACGSCQACNLTGTAGNCAPVVNATDDSCNGTKSCDGTGSCKSALGATCASASECAAGACVDGVCCGSPGCGTCQACNLAGARGFCSTVTNGKDKDSCTGLTSCSATGQCKQADGQTCVNPGDCASGTCLGGVCCSGGACAQDNGTTCTVNTQCKSSHCVDGVCCDTACDGSCEACALKDSEGVCTPVPAGTTPSPACAGDPSVCGGGCDGSHGTCAYKAKLTPCGANHCAGTSFVRLTCDGNGACTDGAQIDCAPAKCSESGCKIPCASNDDCINGAVCDPTSHACVNIGNTCADDVTVETADHQRFACAPYRCRAGSCTKPCSSDGDCAAGKQCLAGTCSSTGETTPDAGAGPTPTTASSVSEDAGGCSTSRRSTNTVFPGIAFALLALARRRRWCAR